MLFICKFREMAGARAELYDITGRRIRYQALRPGVSVMMLDEGRLSPGVYAWRVVSERGELLGSGKVVLQHE